MKLLIKNEHKKRKTVLIKNVTSRLSLMSLCTRQPFLKQIITRLDRQTDRQTYRPKNRKWDGQINQKIWNTEAILHTDWEEKSLIVSEMLKASKGNKHFVKSLNKIGNVTNKVPEG
jgi:hypothetical protein